MAAARESEISETSEKSSNEAAGEEGTFTNYGDSLDFLKGFVLMPFGKREVPKSEKDSGAKKDNTTPFDKLIPSEEWQLDLFRVLLFALNDAFYQNFVNLTVRNYEPILLERADTGAGLSADLLDNIFRKIDNSDFCLADISIENVNVFLEIGYALARRISLVQFKQEHFLPKETGRQRLSIQSDLAGRLTYPIRVRELFDLPHWKDVRQKLNDFVSGHPAMFFRDTKAKIFPFREELEPGKHRTFLGKWIEDNLGSSIPSDDLRALEKIYEDGLVRPLYPAIRPSLTEQGSGGSEIRYECIVFATREDANFSAIFSKARKRIRILTTNLEGLVQYIPDMRIALESPSKLRIEILTLDPESEFVNARGSLIGKEIADFRNSMKVSLGKFKNELKYAPESSKENSKEVINRGSRVLIRIYREFPSQITYIVDDYVYSAVVSVNHPARQNIVFKVKSDRKGVDNSFLQHWDTVWARAVDVR